jgi:hypothetical protein
MADADSARHHTAWSSDNAAKLCTQCRQLDLVLLEFNPRNSFVIRVDLTSDCTFCSFLGVALCPSSEDFEYIKKKKNCVNIRIGKLASYFRGRLVARFDDHWYKSKEAVLLIRLDSNNRRDD